MNIRLATYYHAKDVPALPGSNIFHSTELFHVLEQTRGVRPLLLVAYEGKSPVGKLLCITRRSTNLLRFAGNNGNQTKVLPNYEILKEKISLQTAA